jgi:hypothetical protein
MRLRGLANDLQINPELRFRQPKANLALLVVKLDGWTRGASEGGNLTHRRAAALSPSISRES